jgi:hypothetical protein
MPTALMNELHKLRTDNQDLLSKLDKSSLHSLDLLESLIADQKCINSSLQVSATNSQRCDIVRINLIKISALLKLSFVALIHQDKWMTAKDSLAHTLNVVAGLNNQLSDLKIEYAYFQLLAKEASEMAQEEILSIRCVCCNKYVSKFTCRPY